MNKFFSLEDKDGNSLIPYITSKGVTHKGVNLESILNANDKINVKLFGALGDGKTDDTTAIQTAIDFAYNNGGGVIYFPKGVYIVSRISIYSHIFLKGEERNNTVIKLKDNSNSNLIESYQANTQWNTDANGISFAGVMDLELDGNKANNISGSGIAIVCEEPLISNVYIKNCADHGMRTYWNGTSSGDYGMEGLFSNVRIYNCGKYGWWYNGVHDSTAIGVIVIDASRDGNNLYDGIYCDNQGNARFIGCHVWNSHDNNYDIRHRYALNVDGFGSDFIGCHFEGAWSANVAIKGHQITMTGCKIYAPWNGLNVLLKGTESIIKGCYLMGKGENRPECVGVKLGESGDYVSSCTIDVAVSQQKAGIIDFTNSQGFNNVKVTGYNGGGIAMIGTPTYNDRVDFNVGSVDDGNYRKTNNKVTSEVHNAQTTGVQSIVLGFQPQYVDLTACINGTQFYSRGISDGTSTESTYAISGGANYGMEEGFIVDLQDNLGNYVKASITITPTGFDLTWSKNNGVIAGSVVMKILAQ